MAGRDYASQGKKAARDGGEGKSMIVVMLTMALVLAGGFGGGYWLGLQNDVHHDAPSGKVERTGIIERQMQEIARLKAENEELREQSQKAASVGELNFYHELPRQSVEPTPAPVAEKAVPAAAPRPVAKPTEGVKFATPSLPGSAEGYLVQVASFKSQHDAGKLEAKLAESGLKAYSREVEVPERGRWHRVYLGPFNQRAQAEKVKGQVLEQFRLKALIVSASS